MGLFWLSFADPDKPKGSQFLGVAIVEAESFHEALTQAWALGCNPGGEVAGSDVSDGDFKLPQEFVHRLLDREEIDRLAAYGRMVMSN